MQRIQLRVLGAEHVSTLTTSLNIAITIGFQSKFEESELLLREVFAVLQRVLGDEHLITLAASYNLCTVLHDQHKLVEAEARCRDVLTKYRRVLGADHPKTQIAAQFLARKYSHT